MRPKVPSNPPEEYDDQLQPSSTKRRRSQILSRYDSIKEQFDIDREEQYRKQRQILTNRLDSLITGNDQAFLDLVADLSENRDIELVSLNLYENFLMSRAQKDHDERMQFIEEQYQNSAKEVHDKLTQRLAVQADMLRTGQANNSFLDISSSALDNNGGTNTVGRRNSGLRTSKHTGGYTSNNEATNGTITGAGGSGNATVTGRSRLRRRDAPDTDQGETTDNGRAGGVVGSQSLGGSVGGGIANEHLRFFFSDIDFDGNSSGGYASTAALTSGGPTASGTGSSRSSKQTPKIPSLKPDEIESDLQAMRKEHSHFENLRRR